MTNQQPIDLDTDAPETEGEYAGAGVPARRQRGHRVLTRDVSTWERYLYDARTDGHSDLVGQAVCAVEDSVTPGKADATEEGVDPKTGDFRLNDDTHGAADAFGSEVFARLYGDPAELPPEDVDAGAAWAPRAHDVLSGLQEFEDLRAAVGGDPDMAAFATATMMSAIAPKLAEIAEEERQRADGNEPAPKSGPSADDRCRAAARGAAKRAAQEVGDRRADLEGLAPGLGSSPPTHEQGSDARMKLSEKIASDKRLREILRRAGQLQRISATKRQERKSVHARAEVVDLERGADISRVLPAELAGLKHPKLRLLKLRGIAERSLLQYRMQGTEPMGRGPIVVLLDASGSMSGDPHTWARAVGIACMGLAKREKRACTVIDFDSQVLQAVHVAANGECCLIGGRSTTAPLASFTAAVFAVAALQVCGGTSFSPPLKMALDGLPAGIRDARADLVFVTDGQAEFPGDIEKEIVAAKARGLRIFGATVNGGSTSPAVQKLCDVTASLDKAPTNGKANAAAAVLPAA